MSEKTRRDKTLKLIEDGEDDEVIRVLTGYQPSVIQMLRREAICNITKPDIEGTPLIRIWKCKATCSNISAKTSTNPILTVEISGMYTADMKRRANLYLWRGNSPIVDSVRMFGGRISALL